MRKHWAVEAPCPLQKKAHQRALQRVGLGRGHDCVPGVLGMSEYGHIYTFMTV